MKEIINSLLNLTLSEYLLIGILISLSAIRHTLNKINDKMKKS